MRLFKKKEKVIEVQNEIIKEDMQGRITFLEYKRRCKEQEDYAPGWDAIDVAFTNVYGEQKPQ